MPADSLVRVSVWRKLAAGQGWAWVTDVDRYASFMVEDRDSAPGSWSLTLPAGVQAQKVQRGRTVVFDWRETRFTGMVERVAARMADTGAPLLEFGGAGAMSLFSDVLVYPDPDSPADVQLRTRYQATGPAETVIRDVVYLNMVTRRAEDIVVDVSQGRGASVKVNSFFFNLLDVVQHKCRVGGVGVRVGLRESTSSTRAVMAVEFYVPVDRSNRVRLSHKVGTLGAWEQSESLPTATRVIVAADIEETPRTIASVNQPGNTLTIAGGEDSRHHLATGQRVKFFGKGNPPDPLVDGQSYWAIRVDANTFKVASTRKRALDNAPINLTSAGSGVIRIVQVSRLLRLVTDANAETKWARKREVFLDARSDESDDEAVFIERGQEVLREAVSQTAFSLEAVEAVGTRYGVHFWLGDLVLVELTTDVSTVEPVGAVRITSDAHGEKVQIIPGNPDASTPLVALGSVIRGISSRVKRLEQGEQ